MTPGPKEENFVADCDQCEASHRRKYLDLPHKLRATAQADASRHDESAHSGNETAYVAEYGGGE